MPGGFLGVDIFFIISGFLITSIISREMDRNEFSILTFYRRRTVRIFPALFVLLGSVLVAGCLIQLPMELKRSTDAVMAASGFLSNVYYWRAVDYFGGFAETRPLLHTWSLGVEEQFYIFYPLLLLAVRRFWAGHLRTILWVLVLASFAGAFLLARFDDSAAFYLLPSRAWQLGLGGLIAIGAFPKVERQGVRNLLCVAALGMIGASILFVTEDWLIPAPWALPASLGAALLIAYGDGAATHGLLALPPMRWIGAISYSLYLWHWPIIAFYRLQYGITLTPFDTVLLIGASIAAGATSYYFIEQPVLRRWRNGPSKPIVAIGVATVLTFVALAWVVGKNADRIRDLDPGIVRLSSFASYPKWPEKQAQYRDGICFATGQAEHFDPKLCTTPKANMRNVVLVGDSHAAQYWLALARRFPDINMMQATSSGCRVLIDSEGKPRCKTMTRYVYGELLKRKDIDGVILAGRWRENDIGLLTRTVRTLRRRGYDVTVIGPIDEFEGEFPLLLARTIHMDDLSNMEHFRIADMAILDKRLKPLILAEGAAYYSVRDEECPNNKCIYFAKNKVPIHFDYGHVTQQGAEMLLHDFPRP